MKLYQREDCPFSQKVRSHLTELGLSYGVVNVPRSVEERTELVQVSGQSGTPVLVDDGHVVTGSAPILAYLDERAGRSARAPAAAPEAKTFQDRPSYAMTRQLVGLDVPRAREAVQTVLGKHGFVVLAVIDLAEKLRARGAAELGRPYLILVATHPALLAEAMSFEPYAPLLAPASVAITAEGGSAVVSAARPVAAWAAFDDARLRDVAERMERLLLRVITSL